MKVKKVLFMITAAVIMIAAIYVGITADRAVEAEQAFSERIIRIEETKEYSYKNDNTNILPLTNPNIIVITGSVLAVIFIISIIIARKEGLFFMSKKKEKESYITKRTSKGIAA